MGSESKGRISLMRIMDEVYTTSYLCVQSTWGGKEWGGMKGPFLNLVDWYESSYADSLWICTLGKDAYLDLLAYIFQFLTLPSLLGTSRQKREGLKPWHGSLGLLILHCWVQGSSANPLISTHWLCALQVSHWFIQWISHSDWMMDLSSSMVSLGSYLRLLFCCWDLLFFPGTFAIVIWNVDLVVILNFFANNSFLFENHDLFLFFDFSLF